MISENYGWTWEQIRKLTLREVYIALENIIVSRENYYSFLGAINDKQLKVNGSVGRKAEMVKFDESADKIAEDALKRALERKLKEKGS